MVAAEIGRDAEQSTLLAQGAGGFRAKVFEGVQVLHDVNHWVAVGCMGGLMLWASGRASFDLGFFPLINEFAFKPYSVEYIVYVLLG